MVVGAAEFKTFADEIIRLRTDLDRLERRAAQLKTQETP